MKKLDKILDDVMRFLMAFSMLSLVCLLYTSLKEDSKTACSVLGVCSDCNAHDCICNTLVVTRRCRPAGRIKVLLVGEDLGI